MNLSDLDIKGPVKAGELLCKHTTFGIGGPAKIWAEPYDVDDLRKILLYARGKKLKILLIGAGSNMLASDEGFSGMVVRLAGRVFTDVGVKGTIVRAGAGAALSRIVIAGCKNSLSGFEPLTGIPGTVGGALIMNAGYKTGISDVTEEVRVMGYDGCVKTIKARDIRFAYRRSDLNEYIILEAVFRLKRASKKDVLQACQRLMKERQNAQPTRARSAGCVFRNPGSTTLTAGEIIDRCGLKGARRGMARVSNKHANFIINSRFASSKDVINLVKLIKRTVKKKMSIDLKPEILIIP